MRVPRVLTGAGEEGGSRRAERVAGEIAALLSMRLSRSVRDPRLAGVTITRVRMTPDLRTARIWFALLRVDEDGEAQKEAARALERAQPFFRHEIATALSLRFVPELQFAFDSDLARARRITTLIRDLEHPMRLGAGGADDEPGETDETGEADETDEPGETGESDPTTTTDRPDAGSPLAESPPGEPALEEAPVDEPRSTGAASGRPRERS